MNPPADAICPVMKDIIETMYFCEPVYIGAGRVEAPAIGARVSFSGDSAGEFRVIVAERAAIQMAADFLGADPEEVTNLQARGIVRELANVACGAAMNAWMPAATLHFSIPDELQSYDLGRNCAHGFSLVDQTTELAIDVELANPV